jgi:hypothetical protein
VPKRMDRKRLEPIRSARWPRSWRKIGHGRSIWLITYGKGLASFAVYSRSHQLENLTMPRNVKRGGSTTQDVTTSSGRQTPSADNPSRLIGLAANPIVVAAAVWVVVLAVVLATYWPALSAGALYMDDKFYLEAVPMRNPSWASLKAIFGDVLAPSVVHGYYQPLSLLSVMLDFLDPKAADSLMPFHRTALLLHLFNVALVVILIRLLWKNWVTAGVLGLLYGVHPLNADVVLWIGERKTLLSTCFALCCLVLYVMYARRKEQTGRGDWKPYLACLLAYGGALLSKPTALPVVGLLLVLDYWPLQRRFDRTTLREKVPFLLVAALAAVVAVISQTGTGPDQGVRVMNFLYLPLVIGYCTGFYLWKTVWPAGLVADYPAPNPFGLTNIEVLVGVLCVAGIIVAIVLSARRTRAWVAGGLFFLIAISPTLGIIRYTSSMAANRSMYLPLLGLLLPLAWGMNRLWNLELGAWKGRGRRLILVGVGATLATGSAVATRRYESHWQDSVTLLQYYLTQKSEEWKLRTRLGNEWIQRNNLPLAIAEFREAARLAPNWVENHLNLGRALFTVGEYAEAGQAIAAALQRTPNDWRARMLMGTTLMQLNDLEGALREFRIAAELAPKKAVARFNVGRILHRQGKLEEAAEAYQQTLRLEPRFQDARRALDDIAARKP